MAVDVTPGDEFQAGRAAPLIEPWTFDSRPVRGYDVFPDGSFVTRLREDDDGSLDERFRATEVHVVLNWTEELRERVGNGRLRFPGSECVAIPPSPSSDSMR